MPQLLTMKLMTLYNQERNGFEFSAKFSESLSKPHLECARSSFGSCSKALWLRRFMDRHASTQLKNLKRKNFPTLEVFSLHQKERFRGLRKCEGSSFNFEKTSNFSTQTSPIFLIKFAQFALFSENF